MRGGIALGAVLALAWCAPPAAATVGGPMITRVLGWDPADRKVFVHVVHEDGASNFGGVYYFALDGAAPARPWQVAWTRAPRRFDDRDANARLRRLERRLRPLPREQGGVLPGVHEAVRVEDLAAGPAMEAVARFRQRARWFDRPTFTMTSYHRPGVALAGAWGIPGRSERLLVIAHVGIAFETGYETQVPVLVTAAMPDTLELTWPR